MKKTKTMRVAVAILALTLITSCFVGGTFAKYTTSASGDDTARVAYWGFTNEDGKLTIDELFKKAYDKNVNGAVDVIAPGTKNSATFEFKYTDNNGITAPEVAYTLKVSTDGSGCKDAIKDNANIKWSLDGKEVASWDALLAAIEALDGDAEQYDAGQLPDAFKADVTHTVSWEWIFDENDNDKIDTAMGNATTLADVKLVITITATQVD